MIRDRDRNELELQNMRVVINALDGGLRRFAGGDMGAMIDMSFPAPWDGMRRDFNRGMGALNGTMDSVIGSTRLLREESETLRKSMAEGADRDVGDNSRLSKAAASTGALSQRLREQKARADHAATIAYNARLDMRRPRETVAAAMELIGKLSGEQHGTASPERLDALTATTQQIGRELEALGLYLDALNDQLDALSKAAETQAEAASSTFDELNEVARSRRTAGLKADLAALALDRMDRQIGEIDRKVSRFARVTVITQPPRDPSPHDPAPRGLHLRLVKS